MAGERQLLEAAASASSNNTPFDENEREYIRERLSGLETLIKDGQALQKEQLESVNKRLEHLEEAGNRVGRKDWLLMLLGNLTSLAVSGIVPPERVQTLFHWAGSAFEPLIRPLLQIPGG